MEDRPELPALPGFAADEGPVQAGAWLFGVVRLAAPGPQGRLRVPPAHQVPGPRHPVASREAARQSIAPTSTAADRPALVTAFPGVRSDTLVYVKRETLVALLSGAGEAYEACRTALGAGAEFDIDNGLIPASQLAATYCLRNEITQEAGIPTLGFARAVEHLRKAGDHALRLGSVRVQDSPYYFLLFLSVDASSVVECIGVSTAPRPKAG
ncbi:hypothetical protein [Micromonospora echinofusca]|uniref:Uncharacterized protein n=1 Tax=Micromonospora echinofusca TaxID=47858 RepID=A0ABS3VMY0_MICEH|nr:hypothetical protein [Micromonospora echinofusca]MBO4205880.1 hypothetical protein [Micromonospora echinofusca]